MTTHSEGQTSPATAYDPFRLDSTCWIEDLSDEEGLAVIHDRAVELLRMLRMHQAAGNHVRVMLLRIYPEGR